MSGGGGGGQNTVTTQVEKLPSELVPFYQDLLGRGVYESLTGYETYPFRRLADFDPYEAGAQEAYAEMALEGTPESFREAQEGLREIAIGSPYQRAVAGDQVTAGLFDTIGRAGATPDFYGPREPAVGQDLRRRIGPSQEEINKSINSRMQSDPQFREDYMQSLLTGSQPPQMMGLAPTTPDGVQYDPSKIVPNTTGQRLVGDDRMREIMSLTDDLDATANFSSLEEQQADPRVQRLQELQAQQVGERPQASSEMERYMNPFQQTFIDRQKELARQESARQQSEIGQQAAMAGGLGGYREGIMQAEREKNLMNQMQDIQAAGDMANFEQARRAYESDRQNRMDVADLGIRGYTTIGGDLDRRMRAAQSMADLSGTRQAMEFDRLGQLESAGSRRRALAQQGLDIGYQDFLRQQAFPREQLNLYSGLLRGVPVGPGTYKSVYGDQPSGFQQLLGGGLGAAALYGGLRGSSGGWGGSGNSWGGG